VQLLPFKSENWLTH